MRREVAGILIMVLAGCQTASSKPHATDSTLEPSAPTGPVSTATPDATDTQRSPFPTSLEPTPTPVQPTPTPTSVSSPNPTAPVATSSPDATGSSFVRVRDFPESGEWIADVVAGGPGFVAVGASQIPPLDPNPACTGDFDGRIWTSADGEHWERQRASLDKTPLSHVVEFDGALFALGRPGDNCEQRGDHGYSVWRSQNGMGWDLAATDVGAPFDEIYEMVVTDKLLVALGWHDSEPGVLVSEDGSQWVRATSPMRFATRGASLGPTIVASSRSHEGDTDLHVVISDDGAQNWQDVFVDLGKDDGCSMYPVFATAAALLVAATGVYCDGLEDGVGVAATTTDGHVWSVSQELDFTPDAVVRLPSGFVAFDRTAFISYVSTDGLRWVNGPFIPETRGTANSFDLAAAGPLGVLLVPVAAGIPGRRVLFAPADEFFGGPH